YYTEPTNVNPSTNVKDAYDDLTTPLGTFLDAPFENQRAVGLPTAPVSLLGARTGTTMNYRTIYLQRLANPLAPYHPISNPYLTVDWMPVDLTVFNGEDRKPPTWDETKGQWDPDDNNPNADQPTITPADNTVALGSRQRGQFSTHGNSNSEYNIWTIWPDRSSNASLGGEDPKYSKIAANNNLTNVNFRGLLHNTTTPTDIGDSSLGFLNHSYGTPMDTGDTRVAKYPQYLGDPQRPFPWLEWNNRPYANVGELMTVPASSPARLMFEFSMIPSVP